MRELSAPLPRAAHKESGCTDSVGVFRDLGSLGATNKLARRRPLREQNLSVAVALLSTARH